MCRIAVTYFLDEAGIQFFNGWFKKVVDLVSVQDGYISITAETRAFASPTVYLSFINQEKLTAWANTKPHDDLVLELQHFYLKPHHVEFL